MGEELSKSIEVGPTEKLSLQILLQEIFYLVVTGILLHILKYIWTDEEIELETIVKGIIEVKVKYLRIRHLFTKL